MKISAEFRPGVTPVPDRFILDYMPRANGEFVKLYLYLLYRSGNPAVEGSLADALECTEKDILRGLTYWEKNGCLTLTRENGAITGITLTDLAKETVTKTPVPETKEAPAPEKTDLSKLSEDEEFLSLLQVVTAYRKKNLTHEELDILAYLYGTLGMSAELLEHLVEDCLEARITSIRSMEKIAIKWHEAGIHTVEEAKATQSVVHRDTWEVLKAFGINGRNPSASESRYIEKWLLTFGFEMNIIKEACDRTILQIQKPSFAYADKILTKWHDAEVKTLEDVKKLDGKRPAAKKSGAKAGESASGSNRFHNYQQRGTDYDKLLEENDPLRKGQ